MINEAVVYTDGGSRGNPGQSACAFIVFIGSKKIFSKAFYLGVKTNNEAEYEGLIRSLVWINNNKNLFIEKEIKIVMDSELIVKQINGVYKVKSESLRPYFNKAVIIKNNSGLKISVNHTKRENNKDADSLVNKILDEKAKN